MTVYISGGSNSALRTGWTKNADDLFSPETTKNVSLGATCSVTGLYRLLFTSDLKEGDTVVWEYCLNDVGHVAPHKVTEEYLLKSLEILLDFCAQRNVHFVALLFLSLSWERRKAEPPYKTRLKELLDNWNVKYADISEEYRKVLNVDGLTDACFEDPRHYNTTGEILPYIARRAVEVFADRTVPTPIDRVYSDPDIGVNFIGQFEGASSQDIGTRLLTLPGWQPSPTLKTTRSTDGEVIAAILFAAQDGGFLRLSTAKSDVVISATIEGEGKEGKPRFSPAFLDSNRFGGFSYHANEEILVDWAENAESVVSGGTNMRDPSDLALSGRSSWLIGFVVLEAQGLGSRVHKSQLG